MLVSSVPSQMDLVSTVGEAAALGASGIIMWGGSKDFNSKVLTAFSLDQYASSRHGTAILFTAMGL